MKFLCYSIVSSCALFLMSCNQDSVIVEANTESDGGVRFEVPAFEPEDGSRVNVTINSAGAAFTWSAGDQVATFSREGGLLRFDILDSDANSNQAHFLGAGYPLGPNTEYAAFFPFIDPSVTKSHITVDYTGQKQVGNNNTAHLGAYDYIYSPFQSTNARGEVIFPMNHLGSLVRFQLTMPEANSYKKFRLIGYYQAYFMRKGWYSISSANPSYEWTAQGGSLSLDLQDISNVNPGDVITLYLMMAPEDYSIHWWRLEVTGDDDVVYETAIEKGRKLKAGCIYSIDRSLTKR